MKLNIKSIVKNTFLVMGLVFAMAGCSFAPGGSSDNEQTFNLVAPEFSAGDLYCLSTSNDGVQEKDYYCFESATSGAVVVYLSGNSEYDITNYSLSYNSGSSIVDGKNWLSFMKENDYVKVYNKANCFTRNDGQKGLIGTFTCGSDTITFSKRGKGKAILDGTSFDITYNNNAGIVTISNASNSSDSLDFYYFSDGSLLLRRAVSTIIKSDKFDFYVYMDNGNKGEALIQTFEDLPDGFYYDLTNKSGDTKADLAIVKTLLTQNPNKKFAISPGLTNKKTYTNGSSSYISSIPENYFADIENLCKFVIGGNLDNKIKLETGAFKNCKNLKEVWDSPSIYEFGESCFEGCTALESITISGTKASYDKHTYIKPNAFKGCTNLKPSLSSSYVSVKVSKEGGEQNKQIFFDEIQNQTGKLGNLLTTKYVEYSWVLTTN